MKFPSISCWESPEVIHSNVSVDYIKFNPKINLGWSSRLFLLTNISPDLTPPRNYNGSICVTTLRNLHLLEYSRIFKLAQQRVT
jgi:hypothetical protein